MRLPCSMVLALVFVGTGSAQDEPPKDAKAQKELQKFQGTWLVDFHEQGGKE